MPKVKIIRTAPIAEDGIHVRKYSVGWQGEVSDVAAQLLTSLGAAIIIRERILLPVEPEVKPEILPTEGREEILPSEKKITIEERTAVKIFEISRETKIPINRVITVAKDLGINATGSSSTVSWYDAQKIKFALAKEKSRQG